jgi:hypothetical protein
VRFGEIVTSWQLLALIVVSRIRTKAFASQSRGPHENILMSESPVGELGTKEIDRSASP